MVSVYGLNAKVGNISFYDSTGQSEYSFGKPYSERTAQTIDEEVSKLVEIQYERAKKILVENKDKLTALASQLLEKEVIFKEDLEKIFGDRTFARDVAERTAAANSNGTTVGGPAPTPDETPSLPASA